MTLGASIYPTLFLPPIFELFVILPSTFQALISPGLKRFAAAGSAALPPASGFPAIQEELESEGKGVDEDLSAPAGSGAATAEADQAVVVISGNGTDGTAIDGSSSYHLTSDLRAAACDTSAALVDDGGADTRLLDPSSLPSLVGLTASEDVVDFSGLASPNPKCMGYFSRPAFKSKTAVSSSTHAWRGVGPGEVLTHSPCLMLACSGAHPSLWTAEPSPPPVKVGNQPRTWTGPLFTP